MLLQAFGAVFAILMIYITYISWKRKELKANDFIVWGAVWFGFGFAVVFPEALKIVFKPLHIQGALWFITIASVIFLTLIMFYLFRGFRKQNKRLENLVEELALKELDKK